jgi:hypothetical protein
MLIAGIVLLVLGSVFQAFGIVFRSQGRGWRPARGVITELRPSTSREFGAEDYPTIRYTLPTGQTVEAEATTTAAVDDGEVVGAEVDITYNPEDPQQIITGAGGLRAAGTGFLAIGIALDVVGVVLLVLSAL